MEQWERGENTVEGKGHDEEKEKILAIKERIDMPYEHGKS